MRRFALFFLTLALSLPVVAQQKQLLSPELLWRLKRVGSGGLSADGKMVYFSTAQYDLKTEKSEVKTYGLNLTNFKLTEIAKSDYNLLQRDANGTYASRNGKLYRNRYPDRSDAAAWELLGNIPQNAGDMRISPDGKWVVFAQEVLVKPVAATDLYNDLPNSTGLVYRDLNYRHWDTWEDGKYSHLFLMPLTGKDRGKATDLMAGEPYDAPQKPFGGAEDFIWQPNSKGIVYVCKKKYGKDYAQSTNTDLYYYSLETRRTTNLTAGMNGYDTNPQFSPDGKRLAWLSMRREGYEADKTDIIVADFSRNAAVRLNLTAGWDGFAESFIWSRDGQSIFFNAPWRGTVQAFRVEVPQNLMVRMLPVVDQISSGVFDVAGMIGQDYEGHLVVTRTDMNHAAEIYRLSLNGDMKALSHANDEAYANIAMARTELRVVKTSDGKDMGVWVVYPPNFDPSKKYPTLLYCQGGPQSALTQFYSFRWNFALMAAKGYIVVAPNRRGMPGWGTKWNEAISQDWGGQPMQDYLSAIDAVAKEKYVDRNRLGCVGASYGGYSVFMLAGMHQNRFKSFIAHDGLFDLKSWYGTTEELWFANWDVGGPYWMSPPPAAYEKFNPSNFVSKWNTPIMIIQGGQDFRVGIEQGLEAFQAAQLRGVKSKLLYLPNENHWVLHLHNALLWQREFFGWLDETLK